MASATDPSRIYQALTADARGDAVDPFDLHVAAAVLAVAESEAEESGEALECVLGVETPALQALMAAVFPEGARVVHASGTYTALDRFDDEVAVRDLLLQTAAPGSGFSTLLASVLARRARRPNHLWQDLGLKDRAELGVLMRRHFPFLAHRNSQGMRWKKFLYRAVCQDGGAVVCPAPCCAECDELDVCFGNEDGESPLAIAANG